jgi:hypothetical protein
MPIRFNISWLMIATAIVAVLLTLYINNDPELTEFVLSMVCVLGGPSCISSLIATRLVAIRFRGTGQPMTRSESVAFFIVFTIVAFMTWPFLLVVAFGFLRIFIF